MYRPTTMHASIGELFTETEILKNHLFRLTLALDYKKTDQKLPTILGSTDHQMTLETENLTQYNMLLSLQAAGGIPFFIFLFGSILSVALARIFGTVWLQELIRFVEATVNLFQNG